MCENFSANFGDKWTGCCILLWHFTETALNVRKLIRELWRQMNWLLNHDNAPSHTYFSNRKFFFTKNDTILVPTHPTFLFPWFEIKLKGRHFDTTKLIEAVLNTLTEQDFQKITRSAENCAHALKVMMDSRPKASIWLDGSNSPVNYGWLLEHAAYRRDKCPYWEVLYLFDGEVISKIFSCFTMCLHAYHATPSTHKSWH
jgi:hypothetical protein